MTENDTDHDDHDTGTDGVPTEGTEPYEYWLSPTAVGASTFAVTVNTDIPDADAIANAEPIQPAIRHSYAGHESFAEVVALADAYSGVLRTPDDDPEDTHPLDAVRALRAVYTVLSNLDSHPLFTETGADLGLRPETAATITESVLAAAELDVLAAGIPLPDRPGHEPPRTHDTAADAACDDTDE